MLGAAMMQWMPLPLRSQARHVAHIGMLNNAPRQDSAVDSMYKQLAALGWTEGRNQRVEYRQFAYDLTGLAAGFEAMLQLKCDLIVANGTSAELAVKAHAPLTPMVFGMGADPVAIGLVASLARPGGNATGWTQLASGCAAGHRGDWLKGYIAGAVR